MKKTIALLALFGLLLTGALSAQTTKATPAQAILEFVDDPTQILLSDAKGGPLTVNEGMVLPVGTVVKTLKTGAEIRLKPNGSIIKLSTATTFQIEALKEGTAAGSNDFLLKAGKIRTVAAKLTGVTGPGYNIRTATANCGVRGTDFAMKYDAATQMDWVCVQEGQVDFTNVTTGATVPVATGEFANTFDPVFAAGPVGADKLAQLFSDLDFVRLDPKQVPGKAVPEVAAAKDTAAASPDAAPAPKAAASPASAAGQDFLSKLFGLEVGSVTIDGRTYSKAVLSPTIDLDKFKLGLYLPIIYTSDMFDASTWYRPAGNNEWSFGSDKRKWQDKASDFAGDLALKIKYLEWGTQGVDPTYVKVGNLNDMTLGHGSVVRNFANDQDFPAVRKIGVNAGTKFGPTAVEGLADDLVNPAIVGGRLGFDLLADQVAVGVQAVADLHLANDADLAAAAQKVNDYGDPMLVVGGLDAQLFKVDLGDVFRTKAFVDANTLLPYFRTQGTLITSPAGFDTHTIWHNGLGSLGGETGFTGNVAFVTYRLTYQYERGLYSNALFQGNYYRTRTALLKNLQAYLNDPQPFDDVQTMGVYGSAGFSLFGMVIMDAAYRMPFEVRADGSLGSSDADEFRLGFTIPKGKIPLVNLSGGVAYERSQFIPGLIHGANLFDANTVLKGEVVYGLTQGMDLVIGVSTSAIRDSNGNLVMDGDKPKVAPTVSLDTKLSF